MSVMEMLFMVTEYYLVANCSRKLGLTSSFSFKE